MSLMIFTEYLLVVLLSLQGAYHDDETWIERTIRMGAAARAIDEVASRATCTTPYNDSECRRVWPRGKKELALLLITKGWWESRFAKNVHEGKCRNFECDAVKDGSGNVTHLARTPWQMHYTGFMKPGEWDAMVGTDFESTRTAAWAATRILSRGARLCHNVQGSISVSARGRCNWAGGKHRFIFWEKLMGKNGDTLIQEMEKRRVEHETRDERRKTGELE